MECICPIDAQFADQISALLKPPSAHQVQEYFEQLITTKQCRGLKVRSTGEYGKGVYADLDFEEGDLVLKDQMLVGAQHSSNKVVMGLLILVLLSRGSSYNACLVSTSLSLLWKIYTRGVSPDVLMFDRTRHLQLVDFRFGKKLS